ncbi:hypothetical protein BGP_5505 [Beggiatoa sp. PS]|nr:hypothetical protein BGP_5505 [Beggiatoa sp. PS]
MREQRKSIRYFNHLPIEVWAKDSEKGTEKDCEHHIDLLDNVSAKGMAFESDISWEQDTTLVIRVLEPPIECVGKVAWCRRHGKNFQVGVELIEENTMDNNELENLRQTEIIFEILESCGEGPEL